MPVPGGSSVPTALVKRSASVRTLGLTVGSYARESCGSVVGGVPLLCEHVDVDVAPYVVIGALAEYLLVHLVPIERIVEVIGLRRPTPTNPGRQLHASDGLGVPWVVHLLRYGDGAAIRAEGARSTVGHDNRVYEGQPGSPPSVVHHQHGKPRRRGHIADGHGDRRCRQDAADPPVLRCDVGRNVMCCPAPLSDRLRVGAHTQEPTRRRPARLHGHEGPARTPLLRHHARR